MTCAFDIYVNDTLLYEYDFIYNGEEIDDLPRNNSTLVFDHVLTKDSGTYACQVTTNFTKKDSDGFPLNGKKKNKFPLYRPHCK